MLATVANPKSKLAVLTNLEALGRRGVELEDQRLTSSTRKVYARELAAFESWTALNGFPSDPSDAASVYGYLTFQADRMKLASVIKIAAVLSATSKKLGLEPATKNPRVADMLRGLRRETATKGIKQNCRAALPLDDLRKLLDNIDLTTLRGKRDAAVLLLGFTGAMRRSEIVALNFDDVQFVEDGVTLTIRMSKTNQEGGEPDVVAIPFGSTRATCPVRTLRAWLEASEITDGALFRSVNRHGKISNRTFERGGRHIENGGRMEGKDIALTVQRTAAAAGLDASKLGAHSLRAGCATQAAKKGVHATGIKRLGRWKSNVYERYIRFSTVWEDAPAAKLGL